MLEDAGRLNGRLNTSLNCEEIPTAVCLQAREGKTTVQTNEEDIG